MEANHDQSGQIMASSAPPAATRRAVVVLGMHRSGTSLAAGCLQRLGVDFGPRLMPPNADNPLGYFEHNDVVNLHDRALLALDRSWDDPHPLPAEWWRDERIVPYHTQLLGILRRDFSNAPLWGLKDPRLCRLLPWWESVWPDVSSRPLFLLVRRSPAAVAASLARREGMSAGTAHLLWLWHVLEAEHGSRPHDRLILDFDDLRRDENAALAPVRRWLGLPPPAVATLPVADPAPGRPTTTPDALPLPSWIEEADAALKSGLAGHEPEMRSALDALAARLRTCEPFLAQVATPVPGDLVRQLAATRKQARWYEEEWGKARARVARLEARFDAERQRADHRKGGQSHV